MISGGGLRRGLSERSSRHRWSILMAALKRSLAQDTPAIWAGRPSKSEPGPQQIGASAHCFYR